jgi:DNA-directed RNA polymerase delta subunit
MMEMKMWRASEHDVRAALEKSISERGERSLFVKVGDDEWALRSWDTEKSNAVDQPKM